MPNYTLSSNMSLRIPTVGTDPGPDWADDLNASLSTIDSHDHTSGYGVPITPSGMSINADLTFGGYNATNLKSTRYSVQSAALAAAADLGCLYVYGVDLYYNDASGNQIRLTQSGSIVGTSGSISGLSSPASASYNSGTGVFTWQSAANTAADLDCRSIVLRNSAASSYGMTVNPPAAMASNFSVTFPSLPASQKIMSLDNAGAIAANYTVDGSTITISANVIGVPAGGINTTQLASNAVTTAKITNLAVTEDKINTSAVTTGKIAAANVTAAKIENNVNLTGTTVAANSKRLVVCKTSPSNTYLAVLRGSCNSAGTIIVGEGFSVVKSATGVYDITYTTTFTDTGCVGVSSTGGSASFATVPTSSSSGCTIKTYNSSGAATDTSFMFVVMGQN